LAIFTAFQMLLQVGPKALQVGNCANPYE
jgi:hypothetical protein